MVDDRSSTYLGSLSIFSLESSQTREEGNLSCETMIFVVGGPVTMNSNRVDVVSMMRLYNINFAAMVSLMNEMMDPVLIWGRRRCSVF